MSAKKPNMKVKLLVVMGTSLALAGCVDRKAREGVLDTQKQVNKWTAELAQVRKTDSERGGLLSDLISEVDNHLDLVEKQFSNTQPAVLSSTSKEYAVVVTRLGSFAVQVNNVVPYVNGFKIDFSVGNLINATITSGVVSVKYGSEPPRPVWGKSPGSSVPQTDPKWVNYNKAFREFLDRYNNWANALRSVNTNITRPLEPRTWNNFEVICAPASAEEVAHLEVAIEPTEITLNGSK